MVLNFNMNISKTFFVCPLIKSLTEYTTVL